jgi:hypothetical protein
MGRGAVAITVQSDAGTDVRLVTTHLKSKLLTFPVNRFQPHDEGERARFATYALDRRAAEAATLRVWVTGGRWLVPAMFVPWFSRETSTTRCSRRLRSYCLAHRDQRSAPSVLASPTKATSSDCGISRHSCRRQGLLAHPPEQQRAHRPHPRFRCARQTPRRYANRLTNSSAVSATSRQPSSMVSACPRPGISTISVMPSFFCCFL